MMLACPGVGAAPMIRMPDALESSIQKATDLGALGHHRADRGRCARSAGCGAVLALSAVRAPQRRRRRLSRAVEPAGLELSRHDQRQHAGHRDDRDARRRGDGQRDCRDPRRRRHHDRQQRPVEFLRVGAGRSALSGRHHQGARRGAQIRQVLRQRRRTVPDRLRRQRRHADAAERPGLRWLAPGGPGGRGRGTGPEEEPVIGLTPGNAPKPAAATPPAGAASVDPSQCWPWMGKAPAAGK